MKGWKSSCIELPDGATHIAIDKDGDIYAYCEKPTKYGSHFDLNSGESVFAYLGTILGKAKFTKTDQ